MREDAYRSQTGQTDLMGGQGDTEDTSGMNVPIVFRNAVPEIPHTTYGAFSIYKYPAKFIPQVVAYVLKKFVTPEATVFDPFAGCGTVGLVARIYGHDYELWDLNPILSLIHDTAIMSPPQTDISELLAAARDHDGEFLPDWDNLEYWFPEKFIPLLSRMWSFVHSIRDRDVKMGITIPLLKTTRYFSYADERVHKLYRSKSAISKVNRLLESDWESIFYRRLAMEIQSLHKRLREYRQLQPKQVNASIRAGIDTLHTRLSHDVDVLITSPPYLQAQEYIRSVKMDLFWLGHSKEYIQSLTKMEIPYNSVDATSVDSPTFQRFRRMIEQDHLRRLYDRYFQAITASFSILSQNITTYMCIFVGPAKVRTIRIPIDKILIEHLTTSGWRHQLTYVDPIVSRVMFQTGVNPATGQEDTRIPAEHLVILRRR